VARDGGRCENVVYDPLYGVRVCADTGEVLEENMLDERVDWRAYTPEEAVERARAGPPLRYSLADMGVGVALGELNRPGGVRARGLSRASGARAGTVKLKLARPGDRRLRRGLWLVSRLRRALGLPERVEEEAARLCRAAVERGLAAGRPMEAVATAAAYLACRAAGEHAELDRLVGVLCELEPDLSHRSRNGVIQEVWRAVKLLARGLGVNPRPARPEDMLAALASKLGLPASTVAEAVKILETARRRGVHSGRSPLALAAAALYVASGKSVSLKNVARAAGISEVTVRVRARELAGANKNGDQGNRTG
jgi:transcription initiation factor TFIIB